MQFVHNKSVDVREDASDASSGAVVKIGLEAVGVSVIVEIAGLNLDPRLAKELVEKLFAGSVRLAVSAEDTQKPRSGLPPPRQEQARNGGWGST